MWLVTLRGGNFLSHLWQNTNSAMSILTISSTPWKKSFHMTRYWSTIISKIYFYPGSFNKISQRFISGMISSFMPYESCTNEKSLLNLRWNHWCSISNPELSNNQYCAITSFSNTGRFIIQRSLASNPLCSTVFARPDSESKLIIPIFYESNKHDFIFPNKDGFQIRVTVFLYATIWNHN